MGKPVKQKKGVNMPLLVGFGAIILVGVIIILFRWLSAADSCSGLRPFQVDGTAMAGEEVTFHDLSSGVNNREWNFNDGSLPSSGQTVSHTFQNPGEYKVTLSINNGCASYDSLIVVEVNKNFIPEVLEVAIPFEIKAGQEKYMVGKEATFTIDAGGQDSSWYWMFSDDVAAFSRDKVAKHTFQEATDDAYVKVRINGKYEKSIHFAVEGPAKKTGGGGGGGESKPTESWFKGILKNARLKPGYDDRKALQEFVCNMDVQVVMPDKTMKLKDFMRSTFLHDEWFNDDVLKFRATLQSEGGCVSKIILQ